MAKLTHLDDEGQLSMVDVGGKGVTSREAEAAATIRMKGETLRQLRTHALKKGDALAAARRDESCAINSCSSDEAPAADHFYDVQFDLTATKLD